VKKALKSKLEVAALAKMFMEFSFFQRVSKELSAKSFDNMIRKLKYEYAPRHTLVFAKGTLTSVFNSHRRGW
jgi:hypothetical protein